HVHGRLERPILALTNPSPQALVPFCRQLHLRGFVRACGPSWEGSRPSTTHRLAVVPSSRARHSGLERAARSSAPGHVKPLLPADPHSALCPACLAAPPMPTPTTRAA